MFPHMREQGPVRGKTRARIAAALDTIGLVVALAGQIPVIFAPIHEQAILAFLLGH